MSRESGHPYECMNDWGNFNKTTLPEKEDHNQLNIGDIADAQCTHEERVCKDFKIKKLG